MKKRVCSAHQNRREYAFGGGARCWVSRYRFSGGNLGGKKSKDGRHWGRNGSFDHARGRAPQGGRITFELIVMRKAEKKCTS